MALNVCGYCDVDGFGQPVIEIREVSLYNLQESKCKAPFIPIFHEVQSLFHRSVQITTEFQKFHYGVYLNTRQALDFITIKRQKQNSYHLTLECA